MCFLGNANEWFEINPIPVMIWLGLNPSYPNRKPKKELNSSLPSPLWICRNWLCHVRRLHMASFAPHHHSQIPWYRLRHHDRYASPRSEPVCRTNVNCLSPTAIQNVGLAVLPQLIGYLQGSLILFRKIDAVMMEALNNLVGAVFYHLDANKGNALEYSLPIMIFVACATIAAALTGKRVYCVVHVAPH